MAIKVGVGLSRERDPVQAAKEATRLAKISLGNAKANLALVFSSTSLSCAALLKTLSSYLEGAPIVGCSTAAVISPQGIFNHGVVLMLLNIPPNIYFNTACVKDIKEKTGLCAGQALGEKLLSRFPAGRRDFGLLFCDGLTQEGSGLIYGLQQRLGSSFPIVGASASDNLRFLKTYLYSNREALHDAAAGILWGGKLSFGLGVKHGWKPLGKPRYVTKSNGNVVYEIDNVPAVKVYEEYLARGLNELRKELKRISAFYPIGVYLPGEEEYLLRNILAVEDNGALVLQGDVAQDSMIRLMIGTKESCLAAAKQAAQEAKNNVAHPNFLLVFNSISRYILLGRDAAEELEAIKLVAGENTPVIGLYTYGEQAPLRAINYRGRTYFHNQTVTILALGE